MGGHCMEGMCAVHRCACVHACVRDRYIHVLTPIMCGVCVYVRECVRVFVRAFVRSIIVLLNKFSLKKIK
jgi:hypothetical protein